MFEKILIANRGEIACRIIKTARRMSIRTVAVYSDADFDALHVAMADEAVRIGPAAAAESYLDGEAIIAACRETGAEAVHPGYGFLSEQAAFCRALEAAGIVFIGPDVNAITAMGDKIESKRVADGAGVSTVPGFAGVIESAGHAREIAEEIGYPVMIKASAGGGGKGMRVAEDATAVEDGFDRARSEAKGAFGDDRVFIEKFVERPRHIEIQVLADGQGNVIHLGERECSIQRRNQKVVEEAPSPFLGAETRNAMGEQAVTLAGSVDYRSAGTVEFIVDAERNFYFLEMNTRLQVEHPVTELVTGIDLVEQMIRIAAGERLSIAQKDVRLDGWAVECRLYAEDPHRGFLPSIGRLTRYRPPREDGGAGSTDGTASGGSQRGEGGAAVVRNDTGVYEGAEISPHYDPMLAKLCTWAPTRAGAVDAMSDALDAFVVDGINHNIPFLSALMRHPRWREGRLSTGFIGEEYPDGFVVPEPDENRSGILAAIALTAELARTGRLGRIRGRTVPQSAVPRREWVAKVGGAYLPMTIEEADATGALALTIGGHRRLAVEAHWRPGEAVWRGSVDGETVTAQLRAVKGGMRIDWRGLSATVRILTPRVADLDRLMPAKTPPDTSKMLLCPMPGLVVSIAVDEGQSVKAGETLAIVEAMKMENVLKAEREVTVASVKVKPGDNLAVDAVIMDFA